VKQEAVEEVEMKDATEESKEGKGDVDMKNDEASGSTKRRPAEPASEKLSNFSRVTPAQLSYIRFAPEGRFQPVRAVSSFTTGKSSAQKSERYAGGGGIVMLLDQTPEAPVEFVEPFNNAGVTAPPTEATAPSSTTVREADPPPPFEVSSHHCASIPMTLIFHLPSILSIMIPELVLMKNIDHNKIS
jgi:26S proteasome regulatory subunit N2